MANNYLQYSTQYKFPRGVDISERDQLLEKLMEEGCKAYCDAYGSTPAEEWGEGEDAEPLRERYIGTNLDMETEGVWLYAEECGYPDVVSAIIATLQEYFEDDRPHVFSWAYTCSKMRLDEFGGGAITVIGGKEVYRIDAASSADYFAEKYNTLVGAWRTWENGDGECGIEDTNGDSICTMERRPGMRSHIRLMLALPDLLEACKAGCEAIHDKEEAKLVNALEAMQQAIAKAEEGPVDV